MAVTKARLTKVVNICAAVLRVSPESFFVADHTHEGLSEGSFSIALEGFEDWPMLVTESLAQGTCTLPAGVFAEPLNNWALAVYPA